MRAVEALVGALVVFSGCVGPGAEGHGGPDGSIRSFTAIYELPASDGGDDSVIRVRLDPQPRSVLDSDLELRLALALTVDFESRPAGAFLPTDSGTLVFRHVYYLDHEAIVRTDVHCVTGSGGCVEGVSWMEQGAPWPLGLGWPTRLVDGRLPMMVEGQPVRPTFTEVDGWWSLGHGSVLPWDLNLNPAAEYRYGRSPWLPAQISFPATSSGGTVANLASVQWGPPVQDVPPWPKPGWTPNAPREGIFPGADEQAFGMGVTFQEGYDQIFANAAEAQDVWEKGCPLRLEVAWGGGSHWPPPTGQLLDSDQIDFYLWGRAPDGQSRGWKASYEADSTVVGSGWMPLEPKDSGSSQLRCLPHDAGWAATPADFVQTAWLLPTYKSGTPCSFSLSARNLWDAQGVVLGGFSMSSFLSPGNDDNDPWDLSGSPPGLSSVSMNPDSGHWDEWILHPDDLKALETGSSREQRPLPKPDATEPEASSRYQCVPATNDFP